MTDGVSVTTPRLAAIRIYPLKSAAGIEVEAAAVDEVGLEWDRRWMLVDDAGRFMSQRTHPRMALLRVAMDDERVRVTVKDEPARGVFDLALDPPDASGGHEEIHVWYGGRYAVDCGPEYAAWFSDFMERRCRLVRAVAPSGLDRTDTSGKVRAGFADAEPALVISTASLADLNARLDVPLPMNRFRPNLVIEGVDAYGEDGMVRVRIGDVGVHLIRPCIRCALTTVDQETAQTGKEPLRTLATYRRVPDGNVAFGMNARFENAGTVRVGMPLLAVGDPAPRA